MTWLLLTAAVIDAGLVLGLYAKVNRIARRVDTAYTVPTANAESFPEPPAVVVIDVGQGRRRYRLIGKARTTLTVRQMTSGELLADYVRSKRWKQIRNR